MKDLSDKTKVEIMLGKLVIMIIQSAMAMGALLMAIWLVGHLFNFIVAHTWAFIILGIIDLVLFIKMIISNT